MEDAFFDGDAGTSDWLKLIDEAVSEAMEHFDIDSLAPTGTPKDWVDLVDEVMEWSPFEEVITQQYQEWKREIIKKKLRLCIPLPIIRFEKLFPQSRLSIQSV